MIAQGLRFNCETAKMRFSVAEFQNAPPIQIFKRRLNQNQGLKFSQNIPLIAK